MLTDAGEGLFQNCLQMLAKLDDYVVEARNLQKGPYGTLRVQTTSDYAAARARRRCSSKFARRIPACASISSSRRTAATSPTTDLTSSSAAAKPSLPGLIDRDLGAVGHVVCASPEYFQRAGRPKKPEELREHNCLVNLTRAEGLAVPERLAADSASR